MDSLNVLLNADRDDAAKVLRDNNYKFGSEVIGPALRARRSSAPGADSGRDGTTAGQHIRSPSPQPPPSRGWGCLADETRHKPTPDACPRLDALLTARRRSRTRDVSRRIRRRRQRWFGFRSMTVWFIAPVGNRW